MWPVRLSSRIRAVRRRSIARSRLFDDETAVPGPGLDAPRAPPRSPLAGTSLIAAERSTRGRAPQGGVWLAEEGCVRPKWRHGAGRSRSKRDSRS
jgi:hypothetical protein